MSRPANEVIRLLVLDPHAPPKTRGECIAGTPQTGSLEERASGKVRCSSLKCRANLDRVDAIDVPGRRNNGRDPEWTMTERGDAMSPSCALDVADRGAHRCGALAEMFNDPKQKRRWQQEVRGAVQAWQDALVDTGLSKEEARSQVQMLLDEMERERVEGG